MDLQCALTNGDADLLFSVSSVLHGETSALGAIRLRIIRSTTHPASTYQRVSHTSIMDGAFVQDRN